jgi:hypothetical protein
MNLLPKRPEEQENDKLNMSALDLLHRAWDDLPIY